MYETAGDDLVYLPALNGAHILEGFAGRFSTARDGCRTHRLELWEEAGSTLVSEVAPGSYAPTTRATADASVFAFTIGGELPGFPTRAG